MGRQFFLVSDIARAAAGNRIQRGHTDVFSPGSGATASAGAGTGSTTSGISNDTTGDAGAVAGAAVAGDKKLRRGGRWPTGSNVGSISGGRSVIGCPESLSFAAISAPAGPYPALRSTARPRAGERIASAIGGLDIPTNSTDAHPISRGNRRSHPIFATTPCNAALQTAGTLRYQPMSASRDVSGSPQTTTFRAYSYPAYS